MRTTTRVLGLAVVAILAAGGIIAAPAQATPAQASAAAGASTRGYAILSISVPGLPAGSFVAGAPARKTPTGLVFPISSIAVGTPTTVSLGGFLGLDGVSTGVQIPLSMDLNRAAKSAEIFIAGQTPRVGLLASTGMSVIVKTKIDRPKKIRTTTTTWTGDLLVDATDPAAAKAFNDVFGVTTFTPGGKVGRLEVSISVTAPCKNAACTR